MTKLALLCTPLLLAAGVALGAARDSWGPYRTTRIAAPGGRYYVVLRASEAGAGFELVRRAPAAPAVTSRVTEAGVLEGDEVLAAGGLPHPPMTAHVSPTGRGFVAVDHYANLGRGEVVVAVDAAGRRRFALSLADLFDEVERAGFTRTSGSLWWRRGSWMDEEAGELVLVAGSTMRVVELANGRVRPGGDAQVWRALEGSDAKAQALALELARELGLEGLGGRLVELLEDESRPLGVRVRAARALAAGGDRRGAALCLAVARDEGANEERPEAVRALPDVLPTEEALAVLRSLMRGQADEAWGPAMEAFARIGAPAVPTLLEMLDERGATPDSRGGAAHALKEIGAPAALPALLAAVEDESKSVANAAVNAAIAIGGEDVAPELAAVLARGSTQDGRIAGYFTEVRHADAPAAIRAAQAKHAADSYEGRRLREALAFQEAGC